MPLNANKFKARLFEQLANVGYRMDILRMLLVIAIKCTVRAPHKERDIHLDAIGKEMVEHQDM